MSFESWILVSLSVKWELHGRKMYVRLRLWLMADHCCIAWPPGYKSWQCPCGCRTGWGWRGRSTSRSVGQRAPLSETDTATPVTLLTLSNLSRFYTLFLTSDKTRHIDMRMRRFNVFVVWKPGYTVGVAVWAGLAIDKTGPGQGSWISSGNPHRAAEKLPLRPSPIYRHTHSHRRAASRRFEFQTRQRFTIIFFHHSLI